MKKSTLLSSRGTRVSINEAQLLFCHPGLDPGSTVQKHFAPKLGIGTDFTHRILLGTEEIGAWPQFPHDLFYVVALDTGVAG